MEISDRLRNILIITCTCAILAPIIVYHYKFHGALSNSQTDWGTYGDFIGGLLNPLLATINVAVLIYLTRVVSNAEDKRATTQLRQNGMRDFSDSRAKFLNSILGHVNTNNSDLRLLSQQIMEFQNEIVALFLQYNHAFPLSLNAGEIDKILDITKEAARIITETTKEVHASQPTPKTAQVLYDAVNEKVNLGHISMNIANHILVLIDKMRNEL